MSHAGRVTKLILDTDIDTDCDDVGALAVLHGLARRGQVEIAGVICSTPIAWCVPCVRAINRRYGRPEIPVGGARVEDWETSARHAAYRAHRDRCTEQGTKPLYNEVIAQEEIRAHGEAPVQDAVGVYREILAGAEDGGVTICAIGTLTALTQLLESPVDGFSPLGGRALVERKVGKLVAMATAQPDTGVERFNWKMDLPAAAKVIGEWPTPLAVSWHGDEVKTGRQMMAGCPADHPLAVSYRQFLGTTEADRPSWDQLAVLCATGQAEGLYEESGRRSLALEEETGRYVWGEYKGGAERTFFRPVAEDRVLAEAVERLMIY